LKYNSKDVYFWLRDGEGQQLDYKHAITNPQKIAKTLVAFSNSRGGKLLIGIDDNKDIIGANEEQEKYQILKACKEFCFPAIEVDFTLLLINKQKVLIVEVDEHKAKPIYWLSKKNEKIVYIRSKDKSILANNLLVENLENGKLSNAIIKSFTYHKLIENIKIQFAENRLTAANYAQLNNLELSQAKRRLLNLVLEGVLNCNESEEFWLN